MRWRSFTLAGILLGWGCSDGIGPDRPDPVGAFPTVEITRGFGDAPLESEIVVGPSLAGITWRFEIDHDGDGVPDVEGSVLDQSARVAVREEDSGIYRLTIRLRAGERDTLIERFLVVNDLEDSTLVVESIITPGFAFEGITSGRVNGTEALFASAFTGKTIYRLDPMTLAIQAERLLDMPGIGDPEGLALEPNGSRLYQITEPVGHLLVLDPQDLDLVSDFTIESPTQPQFFLQTIGDGKILTGRNGLVVVDTETEEIIRERVIPGGFHFDLSPDGMSVALVQQEESAVRLLRADFTEVWETHFAPSILLWYVIFHPNGGKLYVIGEQLSQDQSRTLRLIVLNATTGVVLGEQPVESCTQCLILEGFANPVTITHDGRFVVLPSRLGVYLIDTALDFPVHRTATAGTTCCNVAPALDRPEFYVVGGDRIARFRILR